MTATPPPAGPRTQEIAVPTGATAAGAADQAHPAPAPAPAPLPPPAPPLPTPVPAPGTATTAVQPRIEDPSPYAAGPQPTGPLESFFGPPPGRSQDGAPHQAAPHQTAQHEVPQHEVAQHHAAAPAPKAPKAPRTPLDRTLLAGAGLVALSLLLLQLGLSLGSGGDSLWSDVPLWSAFATLAVLAGALPFVPRLRLPGGAATAEKVALGGLAGLGVFWLLVVLPDADTDRGFLLTAALAALGLAAWLAPGRRA